MDRSFPPARSRRVHAGAWVLLSLVVGACGGGGDGGSSPTGPKIPVTITLSTQSLALKVGESSQVFASVQAGPKGIRWTTSDASVAGVDASGTVTGMGAGNAFINAISLDDPSVSAMVAVAVTKVPSTVIAIEVTNTLLNSIAVTVNGIPQGSVGAGLTGTINVARTTSLSVEWDLVRSQTTGGTPVGETIGGTFSTMTNPPDRVTYTVDAVIGDQQIFVPLVQNNTSSQLLMGVNEGLQSQNRCNCVVAAFATGTSIGYYRLYSNSNVRGYKSGSNYTGSYIYWETFSSSVNSLSGELRLTANSAPPAPPSGAASVQGIVLTPAAAAPGRTTPPPRSMSEDVPKQGR